MTEKVLHIVKGDVVSKSLLLAYINGNLDDAEMKRVAQLVDTDPFLKDAVEGLKLADSETVETTLNAIYHDVDVIVGNKKSFTLSNTIKKYAAAAMILVFFGLTFLIMNQLNQGSKTEQEIALSPEINAVTGNDDTSDMGSGIIENKTLGTVEEKNITTEKSPEPIKSLTFVESRLGENDTKESADMIEPSYNVTANSGSTNSATTDNYLSGPSVTYNYSPVEISAVTDDAYELNTKETKAIATTTEKKSEKLANKADKPKEIDAGKAESIVDAGVYADLDLVSDTIYQFTEVLPEFVGGQLALNDYLAKYINYTAAGEATGTVYIKFVVNADGSIADVIVARGISPLADAEALRVVKTMPKWSPGLIAGKPVRTQTVLPIKFIR